MDAFWIAKAAGIQFIEILSLDVALQCRDTVKSRRQPPARSVINLVSRDHSPLHVLSRQN